MSININVKNNDNIKKINKIRVRNDTEIVDSTKGRINVNGVIKDFSLSEELIITNTLYTWGGNNDGQLGNGSSGDNVLTPTQIGTKTWSDIASTFYHVLALDTDGYLYTWGRNNDGQLGNGSYGDNVLTPTQIGTKTWSAIATGEEHSLALDTDGYLWTWGNNIWGQLGNGDTSGTKVLTPTKIGTKTWSSIACGGNHSLALDDNGYLYTWGRNIDGELGNGDTSGTKVLTPTKIGTKTWSSIACGSYHVLAIDTNGYLHAWGRNNDGQIGNGDTSGDDVFIPTKIGTKTWSDVAGGRTHSLALDTDGYLWTWGCNIWGQLGNGNWDDKYTPIKIGTKIWSDVAGGFSHSLALDNNGYLWAWGRNNDGQIGNGDTNPYIMTPIQVENKTWSMVVGGIQHTMTIDV